MSKPIMRCAVVTSVAMAAASTVCAQVLSTQVVATGLDRPVYLTHAPGDPGALFVIEQEGAIRIIRDGVLLPTPFLDIDGTVVGGDSGGDERGLLGLAFSPDYETSGKFYVNYTATISGQLATVVAEYERGATPDVADPTSARQIISFAQPFSNHNGGWMGFSPIDGYLYIFTGDGGSSNDPQNNAARLVNLLGKILRIDVSNDAVPYTVPVNNPFVGVAGARAEIFAYGVRNPWRGSFDRLTGDMYFGDVGQGQREELNFISADSGGGQHFGWRCREGFIATPGVSGCPATNPDWVDPIYDNNRSLGECSIVGGYVYSGCELGSEFQGKYFFADYCTGDVFTLDPSNGFAVSTKLADLGFGMPSFGEGPDGELYLMRLSGEVRKLTNPNAVNPCPCTGDIADDFGTLGADDQVSFGDFLALLGLIGSCAGGTPGCTGDIADDFGTLGGDGQVSFGDFLALLGLIGPCN
jgi:glucose/arabinose dehydrogenase